MSIQYITGLLNRICFPSATGYLRDLDQPVDAFSLSGVMYTERYRIATAA